MMKTPCPSASTSMDTRYPKQGTMSASYDGGDHAGMSMAMDDGRQMAHALPRWSSYLRTLILCCAGAILTGADAARFLITEQGAIADDHTLNTVAIQSAIDRAAGAGGGTVVIPSGTFRSGAIFLLPGVQLHLDRGAVLKGSTNIDDYPKRPIRIEGHTQPWRVALVNADHADHLRITGEGTLDGSGEPFWDAFWAARKHDPKVTNLAVERPRLLFVENSHDVIISGITLFNSGFWNLHLYRCHDVMLEDLTIRIDHGLHKRAPSTDGIDIDSDQDVRIRSCTISVHDDCIALKGSKGPFAADDRDSPPVERITVSGCTFEDGNGAITCGSEATIVRDVLLEDCRITGALPALRLKLRPDTPQTYEHLRCQHITLEGTGATVLIVKPWKQFFDLQGQPPPASTVRDLHFSDIHGTCANLGAIEGHDHSTISGIVFDHIDLRMPDRGFAIHGVTGLDMSDVVLNGIPFTPIPSPESPRIPPTR